MPQFAPRSPRRRCQRGFPALEDPLAARAGVTLRATFPPSTLPTSHFPPPQEKEKRNERKSKELLVENLIKFISTYRSPPGKAGKPRGARGAPLVRAHGLFIQYVLV